MNRPHPMNGLLDRTDFDDDESGNGSRQGFPPSMQSAAYRAGAALSDSGMASPPTPSSVNGYGSRTGSFDYGGAPNVVSNGIVMSGSPFVGNSCSPPASLDPEPRCRSNTWHGQARHSAVNAVGTDMQLFRPPTSSMLVTADIDDHNVDEDDEEAIMCGSRSTPSNSIDLTDATDLHGYFIQSAGVGADRSSGCGSSSSSVNGVGGGLSEIGDGRVLSAADLGGAVTAAMQAGGCRKSSSRRNAWGNLSYADLITKAIESSPERRLTLAQIYVWMVTNVPFFRDKGDSTSSAGWKNSIRHNLSLHNRFIRVQNEGTGKSSWWMLNPEAVRAVKAPRRPRAMTLDTKASFDRQRRRAMANAAAASSMEMKPTVARINSSTEIGRHLSAADLMQLHHQPFQMSPDLPPLDVAGSTSGLLRRTSDSNLTMLDVVCRGRASSFGGGGCIRAGRLSPIEAVQETDAMTMTMDCDTSVDAIRFAIDPIPSPVSSGSHAFSGNVDRGSESLSETLADIFAGDLSMLDSCKPAVNGSAVGGRGVCHRNALSSNVDCGRVVMPPPSYNSSAAVQETTRMAPPSTTAEYFRMPLQQLPRCSSYNGVGTTVTMLNSMNGTESVDVKPDIHNANLLHNGVTCGIDANNAISRNGDRSGIGYLSSAAYNQDKMLNSMPLAYEQQQQSSMLAELIDLKPPLMTSCMYDSSSTTMSTMPATVTADTGCMTSYDNRIPFTLHHRAPNTDSNQGSLSANGSLNGHSIPLRHHPHQVVVAMTSQQKPTVMPAPKQQQQQHLSTNGVGQTLTKLGLRSDGKLDRAAIARILVERPHLMAKMQELIKAKRRQLLDQLQQQQTTAMLSQLPRHSEEWHRSTENQSNYTQPLSLHKPNGLSCVGGRQTYSFPVDQATTDEFGMIPSALTSSPDQCGVLSSSTFFPSDLDLTAVDLGANDMDCDIDQVIEHELALDGKLDFMFDCLMTTPTGHLGAPSASVTVASCSSTTG